MNRRETGITFSELSFTCVRNIFFNCKEKEFKFSRKKRDFFFKEKKISREIIFSLYRIRLFLHKWHTTLSTQYFDMFRSYSGINNAYFAATTAANQIEA